MLNNGKVRLMTKISLYEKKEEKRALLTNRYFKWDYISFHVLKILLSVTFGFLAAFGMWGVYHAEAILTEASIAQLFTMAKLLFLLYGLMVIVYLLISYGVYQDKYQKVQKGLRRYRSYLKKMEQFYEQTDSEKAAKEDLSI